MSSILPLESASLPTDCYVFKHSATCSESARASGVVKAHDFSLPLYWVTVQENRELSNWVAAEYGVKHESPQLLKIEAGKVTQNLHHWQIVDEAIA